MHRTTTPTRHLLSTLFTSLTTSTHRWTLARTLHSDNPMDIHGELHGTATFKPLREPGQDQGYLDMVYREEGEMPKVLGGMAGLRWSKKYVWRLNEAEEGGKMSVWFVKVGNNGNEKAGGGGGGGDEEEADYLFHEFDFKTNTTDASTPVEQTTGDDADICVIAPIPPMPLIPAGPTTVLTARGNHLCINDMYHTAYAFRIYPETGDVISWSSRHVVKGPRKDQDIVNVYEREV